MVKKELVAHYERGKGIISTKNCLGAIGAK